MADIKAQSAEMCNDINKEQFLVEKKNYKL